MPWKTRVGAPPFTATVTFPVGALTAHSIVSSGLKPPITGPYLPHAPSAKQSIPPESIVYTPPLSGPVSASGGAVKSEAWNPRAPSETTRYLIDGRDRPRDHDAAICVGITPVRAPAYSGSEHTVLSNVNALAGGFENMPLRSVAQGQTSNEHARACAQVLAKPSIPVV